MCRTRYTWHSVATSAITTGLAEGARGRPIHRANPIKTRIAHAPVLIATLGWAIRVGWALAVCAASHAPVVGLTRSTSETVAVVAGVARARHHVLRRIGRTTPHLTRIGRAGPACYLCSCRGGTIVAFTACDLRAWIRAEGAGLARVLSGGAQWAVIPEIA